MTTIQDMYGEYIDARNTMQKDRDRYKESQMLMDEIKTRLAKAIGIDKVIVTHVVRLGNHRETQYVMLDTIGNFIRETVVKSGDEEIKEQAVENT